MQHFFYLGLIALAACVLKSVILSMVITRSRLTSALNLVCLALIAQNAFEFLTGFMIANTGQIPTLMVDGVFISLYLVAGSLVYFCMTVTQARFGQWISLGFAGFTALIVMLHFSGLIAQGYIVLGYTIISNEGAFYPLFQLFVVSALLTSIGSLFLGMRWGDDTVRERSKTTLIAIAPLAIVGLGVVALRLLGFDSSSALVMPIASTFFLWILMLDERGEFVTFKVKWRIIFKLATNMNSLKLREWDKEVERQLILEALRTTNNNKAAAAKLLGANQTTFHRKAEQHLEKPPARRTRRLRLKNRNAVKLTPQTSPLQSQQ